MYGDDAEQVRLEPRRYLKDKSGREEREGDERELELSGDDAMNRMQGTEQGLDNP